jgi:hypothetical protein
MPKRHSIFSYFVHVTCAVLFGVGVSYLVWGGIAPLLSKAGNGSLALLTKIAGARVVVYDSNPKDKTASVVNELQSARYVELDKLEIPAEGKFVAANLSNMKITLYRDGQEIETLPIDRVGKKGAAWETPRGLYKIETKERTHFSSIGKVFMPYSMQFNGNYFVHGWTYYPDGTLVSADFSGGCIKLQTISAEKIFNFVDIGTPIYVYSDTSLDDGGQYVSKGLAEPPISSTSYLVADVSSGEILASSNESKIVPIGQSSQFMSSLVMLDAINFFNQAKVTLGQIKEFKSETLLLPGEKIVIKELLYPIL